MKYTYRLAIFASLLLLNLELAATTDAEDGPSQELIDAAKFMGLDESGVRELWRTRVLVIRNQSDGGLLTTVTYELSPDGRSIARNKVTEGSSAALLKDNSRSKPQEDWEYVTNSDRQLRPIGDSSIGTGILGTSIFSAGFPRASLFPSWQVPPGVTPRITTKTEVNNLGQKVTTTTRSYSGTLDPGSNVFRQIFPDISREPGPINPSLAPSPSNEVYPSSHAGPNDFSSGNLPRPSQREPLFVPVIDSTTTQQFLVPLPTLSPSRADGSDKVIDDYLEKVDLSASEIENSNGEVVKTIVDKNGRVLTARFVLSTVKGAGEEPGQPKPTK